MSKRPVASPGAKTKLLAVGGLIAMTIAVWLAIYLWMV